MIDVQQYQDADHDEVWTLHKVAQQAVNADAGDGPWDDDFKDIKGTYIEFLVGRLNGQLVAMGALKRWDNEHAEIKRIRVHPDFWRRGFGQTILSRLEATAIDLGYTTLHLDTTTQQIAAQKLFEKNGYCEVHRSTFGQFEIIDYEKPLKTRVSTSRGPS